MLTDGTAQTTWVAKDKRALIGWILHRIKSESPFIEKSDYTMETLKRVLEEEL